MKLKKLYRVVNLSASHAQPSKRFRMQHERITKYKNKYTYKSTYYFVAVEGDVSIQERSGVTTGEREIQIQR